MAKNNLGSKGWQSKRWNLYKGRIFPIQIPEIILSDNVTMLKLALRQGFSPNFRVYNGTPILNLAISNGSLRCADILLKHGADPGKECQDTKMNALHSYLCQGYSPFVENLIDLGVPLKPRGEGAQSALRVAVSHGDIKVVKLLLESGVIPRPPKDRGMPVLHLAALEDTVRHVEILKLLLKSGANPRSKHLGMTPLDLLNYWEYNNHPTKDESTAYYEAKRQMLLSAISRNSGRLPKPRIKSHD